LGFSVLQGDDIAKRIVTEMGREVMFGFMQLALDVQTFNEVYGPTCNPHNPELSAGGSSGGCYETQPPIEFCVLTLIFSSSLNTLDSNLDHLSCGPGKSRI